MIDKLKLIKKELKGLDVEYKTHYGSEFEQALVNGHSIIWHQSAYCNPTEANVEVYFKGDDNPTGYVPIQGLRAKVMR